MALSDYERQMLADLESQLSGENVKFAEALAQESNVQMRLSISPKNLVLGLVVVMLGLVTVLTGVAIEIVALGVFGVIVIFLGFWYVSAGFHKKPIAGGSAQNNPKPWQNGGDFMQKQAEEWLKRMQGGNSR